MVAFLSLGLNLYWKFKHGHVLSFHFPNSGVFIGLVCLSLAKLFGD